MFISFSSLLNTNQYAVNNKRQQAPYCPNLAPLQKDTVSFSGRGTLISENMSIAPTERTCRQVERTAEPARYYLELVLDKYLQPLADDSATYDDDFDPVIQFETRIKSSTSIREKVVSKYTKFINEREKRLKEEGYRPIEKDEIYDTTSTKGVKHYANDIVGARITMKDSTPAYTGLVLAALKRAVEDGALKVTSIENNMPDPTKLPKGTRMSDFEYATDAQLRSLAKTANAQLIRNKTQSGYMAIHVNIDLSDQMFSSYNSSFDGYTGEIQIIGTDVKRLKEVEDLCYKLKDEKNAIKSKYKPFKTHFQAYYNNDTKDAFEDYTHALYIAQRMISPNAKRDKFFPSIAELGFEGKVPPELDFNYLKALKDKCDTTARLAKKQEELEAQSNPSQTATIREIKQQGEIDTMKNIVSYIFRQNF